MKSPAAVGLLVFALVMVLAQKQRPPLATGGPGARSGFRRRGARARRGAVDRATPDLVDLFVLASSVGHSVHRSLELVAPRAPLAVRPTLAMACARVARGAPLAQVLGEVGRELGPLGTTLTDALVAGLVTGAPLGPPLAGVAEVARDHRRRQAEEAAKRLPVTLLLPLVCCVLPAFTLLAVVPLVAGSFASLRV